MTGDADLGSARCLSPKKEKIGFQGGHTHTHTHTQEATETMGGKEAGLRAGGTGGYLLLTCVKKKRKN